MENFKDITAKKHGRNRKSGRGYRMSWGAPCSRIAPRTPSSTLRTPTVSGRCASYESASWSRQDHRVHGTGRGGDSLSQDTQTRAFSPRPLPPAWPASTAPCAVDGAFASSGPAGNLGCIFRIHIYQTQEGYGGIAIPPPHRGLFRQFKWWIENWLAFSSINVKLSNRNDMLER